MSGTIYMIRKSAHVDSTNGGVSGKARLAIVSNIDGPAPVQEWVDAGAAHLILIDHPAGSSYGPILVPATRDGDKLRVPGTLSSPMFGGNYVDIDGRLVSIHDRFETPEQNNALSI